MANWTVTDSTSNVTGGATVNAGTVDLTISPVAPYTISASLFKIGGASNSATNEWTGGNVDTNITKVVFSDLGTAGDPNNTVRARIHHGSFTMPTSNRNIYIDIDTIEATEPTLEKRNVCIGVWYEDSTTDINCELYNCSLLY